MKTLEHAYSALHFPVTTHVSIISRFFTWCTNQEKNRLGWLAVIIAGHGCFVTPFTLLFVMLAGNNFIFWPLVIGAMGMSLVSNLSALPTRITLPIFFLSLLIDLLVIINCIAVSFIP